jgi:hypothetical protein
MKCIDGIYLTSQKTVYFSEMNVGTYQSRLTMSVPILCTRAMLPSNHYILFSMLNPVLSVHEVPVAVLFFTD